MSMKINKLEIENVKRIKAVKVEPKANGLMEMDMSIQKKKWDGS